MNKNFVLDAKTEVEALIRDAFAAAEAQGKLQGGQPLPAFTVEIPADSSHGDFATNAAMVSAKTFRSAPVKIAGALVECMDFSKARYIDRAEIAGPGFINFFVSPVWFADIVAGVLEAGDDYGRSDYGKGEKVMVEFVSANPTGPMHMGNARGGAIGDCLAAAMDACGYDVTREFYINDAGNQIEKFGLSLEARYLQIFKGEEAVRRTATTARTSRKGRSSMLTSTGTACSTARSRSADRHWWTLPCQKISRSCAPTWKNTALPMMYGSRKVPCISRARSRQWSTS